MVYLNKTNTNMKITTPLNAEILKLIDNQPNVINSIFVTNNTLKADNETFIVNDINYKISFLIIFKNAYFIRFSDHQEHLKLQTYTKNKMISILLNNASRIYNFEEFINLISSEGNLIKLDVSKYIFEEFVLEYL